MILVVNCEFRIKKSSGPFFLFGGLEECLLPAKCLGVVEDRNDYAGANEKGTQALNPIVDPFDPNLCSPVFRFIQDFLNSNPSGFRRIFILL